MSKLTASRVPRSIGVLAALLGAAGPPPPARATQVLAPVAAEAPLALTASDGSGLELVALDAQVVVEDPLAFTELRLVFRNPEDRVREGRFRITLPPGAAISRFAMKIGDRFQEGEVVELQAARQAYEDFLHRRQDPALLEGEAGNEFSARVFPIPARATKELIVSYSQELTSAAQPYRLPLVGLPRLGRLTIRALVDKGPTEAAGARALAASSLGGTRVRHEAVEVERRDFTPDRDFEVPLPAGGRLGLRHDNLVVARVQPLQATLPADPIDALTVLVDTSASRALGFRAQLERLGVLLREVAGAGDPPVVVVAFDQEVEVVYRGRASGFGREARERLAQRRALGASDLGRALEWAGKEAAAGRLLLVSDGVATAGLTANEQLQARVRQLAARGIGRLDVLAVGGIRDQERLARLVAAGLPRAGVVLAETAGAAEQMRRLTRATRSGLAVEVEGAAWVWPQRLDGVQPGDEVLVYADLPAGQPLRLRVGGQLVAAAGLGDARPARHHDATGPTAAMVAAPRPLLERAWVKARLARLSAQREPLAASDPDLAEALRKQMIELSVRHRVLSPDTALLVLETEDDYHRFGIERRALADILTVGPAGLAVLERRDLAGPAPTPIAKGAPPRPVFDLVDRDQRPEEGEDAEESEGQGQDRIGTGARAPTSPAARRDGRQDAPATAEYRRQLRQAPRAERLASPRISGEGAVAGGNVAGPARERNADDALAGVARAGDIAGARAGGGAPSATAAEPARKARDEAATGLARDADRSARSRAIAPRDGLSAGPPSRAAPQPQHEGPVEPGAAPLEIAAAPPPPPAVAPAVPAQVAASRPPAEAKPAAISPYEGELAQIMALLARGGDRRQARERALAWRERAPADVLALVALGEAAEASGELALAARAYGSIIDLFPGRADLRRFAGNRLERLRGAGALALAVDTYRQAVAQRPDHPAGHRLLAFALVKAGRLEEAFAALVTALGTRYPDGRFAGVREILREDLGLVAAAWQRAQPARAAEIQARLGRAGGRAEAAPSLRFVLTWETDANDVDFHIRDARGGHAYYSQRRLASGGELYADVTTGYGPECFTVRAPASGRSHPYRLAAHYYSRGPMGYGMGKLQVIDHDGQGRLRFEERPFVVMRDGAFVELGSVGTY